MELVASNGSAERWTHRDCGAHVSTCEAVVEQELDSLGGIPVKTVQQYTAILTTAGHTAERASSVSLVVGTPLGSHWMSKERVLPPSCVERVKLALGWVRDHGRREEGSGVRPEHTMTQLAVLRAPSKTGAQRDRRMRKMLGPRRRRIASHTQAERLDARHGCFSGRKPEHVRSGARSEVRLR